MSKPLIDEERWKLIEPLLPRRRRRKKNPGRLPAFAIYILLVEAQRRALRRASTTMNDDTALPARSHQLKSGFNGAVPTGESPFDQVGQHLVFPAIEIQLRAECQPSLQGEVLRAKRHWPRDFG